jgi:hypothetical protein
VSNILRRLFPCSIIASQHKYFKYNRAESIRHCWRLAQMAVGIAGRRGKSGGKSTFDDRRLERKYFPDGA